MTGPGRGEWTLGADRGWLCWRSDMGTQAKPGMAFISWMQAGDISLVSAAHAAQAPSLEDVA